MRKTLLLLAVSFALMLPVVQGQVCRDIARDDAPQMVVQQRVNAPDFTVTFTNGTTVNLYTVLNAGNSVMLDMFFTT
jgi:hypothetical protein